METKERLQKKDLVIFFPPIRLFQKDVIEIVPGKLDLPYGALKIASYLKENGISSIVIAIDSFFLKQRDSYELNQEKCRKRIFSYIDEYIEKYDPKAVGISLMYTIQEPFTKEIISHIYEKYPEKKIIIGGNHATFTARYLLLNTEADVVIIGEGEETIYEVMQKILDDKEIGGIKGVLTKKDGVIIENKQRELMDIKLIPPTNYDLLGLPDGLSLKDFHHYVMVSRGCFGDCDFCTSPQMWLRKFRVKKIETVKEEIETLHQRGISIIELGDDTLTMFSNLGEMLAEFSSDITFFSETRVDVVLRMSKKELDLLRKANIKRIYLGLESESEKVLQAMGKGEGLTYEKIKRACKKLKDSGIEVGTFWIFGHPASSKQEDRKSIQFMEEMLKGRLNDDAELHILRRFPGTKVSGDPRIRIIEKDYNMWGFVGDQESCHEVIDPKTGKVIYSAEDITKIYQEALEIRNKYLSGESNVPLCS